MAQDNVKKDNGSKDREDKGSEQTSSSGGIFGSLIGGGGDATQRVWGLWESVKSHPTVQQAQQQAQEAWKSYDNDSIKQKLADLGKVATTYIDEADRKLETLENEAVSFLQHRGAELVDKVKEATHGQEHDGEVLFNGPEGTRMSRLDAELMVLNAAPDQIQGSVSSSAKHPVNTEQKQKLLQNTDLNNTYQLLVPSKLKEEEFWNSYLSLRDQLEKQDSRRKQLIQSQKQEEQQELDDWGSSDEDETTSKEGDTQESLKKVSPEPTKSEIKKIDETASDSDWE